MPRGKKTTPEPSVTELVEGIVGDAQKLLSQQVDLLRQEVKEELRQAAAAGVSAGAGAGLVTLGGVLGSHMLVHLLHQGTRLPLWSCYGLVGGCLAVAGAQSLRHARGQATSLLSPPLPQSRAALQENMAWLRSEVTGDGAARRRPR